MNKTRSKYNEISLDKPESVTIDENENFYPMDTHRQTKYYKGKSINSLKFILIILVFYFVGFSEAHAGNPVKKSRNSGLVDDYGGDGLDPLTGAKPFNFDDVQAKLFPGKLPVSGGRSTSSILDSDSSDSDDDLDEQPKSKPDVLADEAKKVLSSGKKRSKRGRSTDKERKPKNVENAFSKRLDRPVESDSPRSLLSQKVATNLSNPNLVEANTNQNAFAFPDTSPLNTPAKGSLFRKLPEVNPVETKPVAETPLPNTPAVGDLLRDLGDVTGSDTKSNVASPLENQVSEPAPVESKAPESSPEVSNSGSFGQPETILTDVIPKEDSSNGSPFNTPVQNTPPVSNPLGNAPSAPVLSPPVENQNADFTAVNNETTSNENAVPPQLEEPSTSDATSAPPAPKQESNQPTNDNSTPLPPQALTEAKPDSWASMEEVAAPSTNVFSSEGKPSFFNKREVKFGSTAGPDDDFDLQEVEKVNAAKVDPHISQQIDNEWLKKQKQSQMIGTQIPVATSYEYNRAAHVLEPKFESPKVLGGIIQTLTDKEAKLRRMEKRKLKIQHDLNLYISKESAHVVNMLNNGEVNKLQKMHPLVFMRLQEVFQTQQALNSLINKDGDKVKKYDKSWYLNSTPTAKASFIEEIRRYCKDTDLYGKFKKPKKIDASRESVYKKLELFHNDYICQRIVRENQYSEKILRSLEQQSGLYLAPYYHNIVPGLGNLWLIKNFEKYYMEAVRSKVTSFGAIAPLLVGKFMLMVENGTILPSTPSSQVAIHTLSIMLSLIMDGVREPKTFLGKTRFYGFMSLCDSKCVDLLFVDKGKKNDLTSRQVEFLKWVLTFHSEDLMLIDTYAQRIVLNNMYTVTREDIYRSSPRNIQLRIQSEFTNPRAGRRGSFLELKEEDEADEASLLQLEDDLGNNREQELRDINRRLLEEHGEKKRQEYRKMQLEKALEQQRKELQKQQAEKESDTFQKAMKERERILRRAEEKDKKPKPAETSEEKPLFVKEETPNAEEEAKQKKETKPVDDKNVYDNVKTKLETLGSNYNLFLKRFMAGYHAPGKTVDSEGDSQTIVPFHVFVPTNKPTGGYDNQFLDVAKTLTDLVNLASHDSNAYFHSLNTLMMIRTVHGAIHSFESAKTKNISGSKTLGALFRWLNTDSNRYLSHVPKKHLPFASLSLQLLFFFQELVENYSINVTSFLGSFFKGLIKKEVGKAVKKPRGFHRLNSHLDTYVVYDPAKYKGSLETLKELVDMFKDKFLSKPSIPAPIIQYISVFVGLWAQGDADSFTLSEKGAHRAKKMFLLSFLSNKMSLAEMATKMVLTNCKGLKMLHLGCVLKVTSTNRSCNQMSVKVKEKHLINIFRTLESTSLDPLDVIRIASDTCRRCAANLAVRPHVGAPVTSYLELGNANSDETSSDDSTSSESESEDSDEEKATAKESAKESTNQTEETEKPPQKKSGEEKQEKSEGVSKPAAPKTAPKTAPKNVAPPAKGQVLPHFVDRLMLHSEITHKLHCYTTQKEMVKKMIDSLAATKDEVDARQIISNVFAEYRTIEVIQSGMASSIHRLICPFMIDAPDSVRVPTQTNIVRYAVNKMASKISTDFGLKELFKGLKSKIDLLLPTPDSFGPLTDIPGCVFVGTRNYNGVYFAGGYAPFPKIDKPTNIALRPGEGRLVYDGDNFVPEVSALSDVSDLQAINVVHERDYDKIVYQVKGEKGPVMLTERAFALAYPNFVIRAHVLITAKALTKMGFDMGRVIWCGERYGWVADFVLTDVVPGSDVPVYNGQYWLLASQLSVKDVVGNVPIRFVNEKFKKPAVAKAEDQGKGEGEDADHLGDKPVRELDVEIRASGKKVGEVKSHDANEVASDEDEAASEILVGSAGDSMSATPGAVKSVKSAVFNPSTHKLTLDLDMPDFVFSG